LKKQLYIFVLLFKTLLFYTQNRSTDSLEYKKLFKEYNAVAGTDRSSAFNVLDKIEKKSTAQNNFFYLSEALVYKAILYYYENDYDSAKYFINRSLSFSKKANNYKVEMRAYNLLGAIYYNQGDFKNTEKYYAEKIKVAEKNNDTASVYGTYYNMGLVYFQQGNYLKSADFNFKALPYFERVKDTFNVISSLQSIGYTYMNLQDIPSSLTFYYKAIKLANGLKDKYQLAGIYIDVATAYSALGKNDSALSYLDLALKLSAKHNDNFHFTIALNNKADHYLKQKNYQQALLLSKEAEKLNLKDNRRLALCEVYSTMSNAYYHLNNLDSSLKYARKGYSIGTETEQSKMIRECTRTLSYIFEARKNSDSALKYYKLYTVFNDTLKQESQLRGIAQKEFLFEKQNQEALRANEKLIADTQLEKQKQINLIVIIASVLLAIFLLIGIINYRQKQKANALVVLQKKLLEEKNKEVADSINYASRIQKSIMLNEQSTKEILPNSFVLYLPKDIVSGDFYWISTIINTTNKELSENLVITAVVDCTGHGVPGAFMSLIGSTLLNQTLTNSTINSCAQALDFLNEELPKNIKSSSTSGTIKDGMEISMGLFDLEKKTLNFAGANNNLYLVRNGKMHFYTGDKKPIGQGYETKKFTDNFIDLQPNDIIYMFTDGYPDQFGGEKGKKFKYKQLEEILLENSSKPLNTQKEFLQQKFLSWKGELEQVDDVCIMGIKI